MEEQKHVDFIAALEKMGSNPNEYLNQKIDEVLENERREEKPDARDTNEHRQPPESTGTAEKTTVTFDGKTYEF